MDADNDPRADGFQPPAIPTEVFCLHCQQEYEEEGGYDVEGDGNPSKPSKDLGTEPDGGFSDSSPKGNN